MSSVIVSSLFFVSYTRETMDVLVSQSFAISRARILTYLFEPFPHAHSLALTFLRLSFVCHNLLFRLHLGLL